MKSSTEKNNKQLEAQINELNSKNEISQRELAEVRSQKAQIYTELQDKLRLIEDTENQVIIGNFDF